MDEKQRQDLGKTQEGLRNVEKPQPVKKPLEVIGQKAQQEFTATSELIQKTERLLGPDRNTTKSDTSAENSGETKPYGIDKLDTKNPTAKDTAKLRLEKTPDKAAKLAGEKPDAGENPAEHEPESTTTKEEPKSQTNEVSQDTEDNYENRIAQRQIST